MKRFILLLATVLWLWPTFASAVSVCGMPSSSPVNVRVYDVTVSSSPVLVQNWTATGVTELPTALGKSCYFYTLSGVVAGRQYQLDWEDSPSPTRTASETLYGFQTNVNEAISAINVGGSGNVAVTANYGSPNNLRYTNAAGAGIANAVVTAFLASDYAAGNTGVSFQKGSTVTLVDGTFAYPLMLNSGFLYSLIYSASGYTPVVMQLQL